jgi:xylulokinase
VASTDVIGRLRPEAAAELGLPAGVQVVGGSPDHQSALVGSGAVRDFEGHLYVGTSSWIECIVPWKKTDLLHSIASLPSAIPGRYQCVNEQDMAGGCLAYLKENVFDAMRGLGAGAEGVITYADLDAIAANVPAGARGLIFAPWLNGERTPVDSTTLRGGFFNLSMTTSAAEMVRSVLEGVAYNTRWSLGYVEKFVGRRLETLNFIGGGAKSPLWCRIFADVLGRTIRQVKDPIQANARGAAFIAAVGLGEIAFEDIPSLIQIEATWEPDPRNRSTYDALHREFLAFYRATKGIYRRLNAVTPGTSRYTP